MNETATAAARLRGYLERMERLRAAREALAVDSRALDAEIKAAGFVPRILRQIVKARAADPAERAEGEALLALYARACGVAMRPDARDAVDTISALAEEALRLHRDAAASGALDALRKSRAAREAALKDGAAAAGIRLH